MRINAILIGILAVGCADKDEEERELSPFLDSDQDGFPEIEDCNDKDPAIHPDALEMCDGIDNNCDGVEDEETAYDAPLWFEDKDGDNFGDPNSTAPGCEPPVGYVGVQTDCNDLDSSSYPGAVEMCDTVDNDCDGTVDEGTAYDARTWYKDEDRDGFGSFFAQIRSCEQPMGYTCVLEPTDDPCNDNCDNDMDGLVDAEDPDCEGFDVEALDEAGVPLWSKNVTTEYAGSEVRYWDYNRDNGRDFDCEDNNEGFSPGVQEQCDVDDMDENCDGVIDNETLDLAAAFCDPGGDEEAYLACLETVLAAGMVQWNLDSDLDGYGNPDAAVDACDKPEPEPGEDYVDNDLDCDDSNKLVNPYNAEVCGDEVDNDCDGEVDEEDAPYKLQWYRDSDGDDYGDVDVLWPVEQCLAPDGYVADATDCDDSDASINPGEEETWYDGEDQDCDGNDDDEDEDGYIGVDAGGDDCIDDDSDSHPDAPEVCGDGDDNNCDGVEEECDVTDAIIGLGAFDKTGASVSMGGDVNSDGRDDMLVGAALQNGTEGGLARGAVYLVHGDISGSVPTDGREYDATIFGENDHDHAGSSVAIVGDSNGNGNADILIGAFAEDAGGSEAGAAYLVIGPVSGDVDLKDVGDTVDGAKLTGEVGDDKAGLVVAAAGDTNDDGLMDFYVGAPGYDDGDDLREVGATYLLQGPIEENTDLSFAYFRYVGAGSGEESGSAIANAGDFNGDGFDDAIIGAPNAQEAGAYTGAVYLVLNDDGIGGSMSLTEADVRWHGASGGDQVGFAVSTAGDQNLDGYADIIIGAPGSDEGGAGSGAAYIVYGMPSDDGLFCSEGDLCASVPLDTAADAVLVGERGDDYSGGSVAGGGDIDQDGNPDVVVGSRLEDSLASNAGAASVMFGPLEGTVFLSDSMAKIVGDERATEVTWDGAWVGASVAMGGDINGDGYGDVMAGAPGATIAAGDEDLESIGAVLILKGGW